MYSVRLVVDVQQNTSPATILNDRLSSNRLINNRTILEGIQRIMVLYNISELSSLL